MMQGHTACRHRHRGFTLIEMLVALALLALLAAGLVQAVQFALRTERVTQRRAVELDSLATTQQFLFASLSTIYPYAPPTPESPSAVIGTSESLEYTAAAPQAARLRGHYRYRLSIERVGNALALTVRYSLDRHGFLASRAPAERDVLLSGFSRAEFAYWSTTPDGGALWSSTWTARSRAPQLIRLTIDYPSGDRRVFPAIIVRPRIEADAQCEFDPVSRRCREVA